MSTTPARYRLVIFEPIVEPQPVRDLFGRAAGMHPTDAMQGIARAPGTWPWPMEETEVRQVLDGLYELGIAAEAWRADIFPELSPARTIHRAACLDEGFRAEGLRGEPTHWVPWDRVELICAGRIVREDEFRNIYTPRWPSTVVSGFRALVLLKPQPIGRHARAARIPRDPVGEVIIVRRDPRIAFRVVENQMNYAYLGPRLAQSAAENFPIFVADLCAAPTTPTSPPRPVRCSTRGSRPSTNSPARRRCWSTPPIACSGAGIAAIARPREAGRSRRAATRATTSNPSGPRRTTPNRTDRWPEVLRCGGAPSHPSTFLLDSSRSERARRSRARRWRDRHRAEARLSPLPGCTTAALS